MHFLYTLFFTVIRSRGNLTEQKARLALPPKLPSTHCMYTLPGPWGKSLMKILLTEWFFWGFTSDALSPLSRSFSSCCLPNSSHAIFKSRKHLPSLPMWTLFGKAWGALQNRCTLPVLLSLFSYSIQEGYQIGRMWPIPDKQVSCFLSPYYPASVCRMIVQLSSPLSLWLSLLDCLVCNFLDSLSLLLFKDKYYGCTSPILWCLSWPPQVLRE